MYFIVTDMLSYLLPRIDVPVSPIAYSSVQQSRFLLPSIWTTTHYSCSLVLKSFRPSRWALSSSSRLGIDRVSEDGSQVSQ